jgi:hypothetical protein
MVSCRGSKNGLKAVVVTPAGRKHYLELLKHYVLSDPLVAE